MPQITFSHVIDGNIGDYASCPIHYLGAEMRPHAWVDVRAIDRRSNVMVFGGGGLFMEGLEELIKSHFDQRDENSVWAVWGAGLNRDGDYPEWLNQFDLVGMRDESAPYRHVPCPTCLHPAFDRAVRTKPTRPFVAYSHYAFPIHDLEAQIPQENNSKPFSAFAEVIDFLASGDVILTTSYHGFLWGQWLGRRTLLMNDRPKSKKFHLLTSSEAAIQTTFKKRAAIMSKPQEGLLEDARRKNRIFWRDLQNTIETKLG